MTRVAPLDAKLVERFVRTQPLRHPVTPKNYAGTLRNFNSFVTNHGARTLLTVSILGKWLKERSLKWPAHILYPRTLLVERYLAWLQGQGAIESNPFAELHRHYGPRTTPIVRALVCEDSRTALQKLRRPPPFGSFLGKVMEEHVAQMRALGYRYNTVAELLLRFDRFLQSRPELSGLSLNELVERWVGEQPSPSRLFDARKAGRVVSKAMHRVDPRVPVLPIGDGVARAARQHHRCPPLHRRGGTANITGGARVSLAESPVASDLAVHDADPRLLRRLARQRDRAPEARGYQSARGDHRDPRDEVLQASPLLWPPV